VDFECGHERGRVCRSAQVDAVRSARLHEGAVSRRAVRSPTFGDATLSFGTVKLGENNAPNVSDHYRIGSNTKPMTATIVLQLVQEGKLALEDPISRY
jgi:D-alanyl-D-alanine carboxypeptidase